MFVPLPHAGAEAPPQPPRMRDMFQDFGGCEVLLGILGQHLRNPRTLLGSYRLGPRPIVGPHLNLPCQTTVWSQSQLIT